MVLLDFDLHFYLHVTILQNQTNYRPQIMYESGELICIDVSVTCQTHASYMHAEGIPDPSLCVSIRAERYYRFSDISRYFESIDIAIFCY